MALGLGLGATRLPIMSSGALGSTDDFIMTVRTTGASESFTIPTTGGGYNYDVDWGDGNTSTGQTGNASNTYAVAGDYEVKISGTFPRIYFNNTGDKAKVIEVKNLGKVGWTSFQNSFFGCSNMTSFTSGTTDISGVSSLRNTLYNCTSLTSCNFSGLNTSSITSMAAMFFSCSSIVTLDLSMFNTSSVVDINNMFRVCSSLTSLDITSFDTSSVANMNSVFNGCTSLTDYDPSGFNIEGLDGTGDLDNFATGTTIPTANYDALLINWASQTILSGMSPNFGSSKYTSGGAAETARTSLINDDGMTITDGGPV